jgi:hypothetical protein
MMTEALALLTMVNLAKSRDNEKKIPEPEFKPFRFPKHEAVAARVHKLAPTKVAREPRTLEELGIAGELARELESTFRLMGLTRGDRVVGLTFTTPDGVRHGLRLAAPARDAAGLAA